MHIDNKNKDIEGPSQGLDDTTLTTETKYPTNFYTTKKKICIKSTL